MATKGRSAAPAPGHILREAEAITGGALALFLALSLFSFSPAMLIYAPTALSDAPAAMFLALAVQV